MLTQCYFRKPIIHILEEATLLFGAKFLKKQSSRELWLAISKLWSQVYVGSPDFIHVDQGTNFVSEQFKACYEAECIRIIEAPIESPATKSHVEIYHPPSRAAGLKLRDILRRSTSNDDCLQFSVKAIKDTVGPEEL